MADVIEQSSRRTSLVPAVKAVRINVGLSERNYEDLKQAAAQADMDMSAYVRNAISVYNFLQDAKRARKRIYIGEDDKLEKEIIIP